MSEPPAMPMLATLNYSTPSRAGRPGVLTAVGVLSIIFGGLGTLSGLGSVMSGYLMLKTPGMFAMPAATAGAAAAGAAAGTIKFGQLPMDAANAPDQFDAAQRTVAIDGLSRVRPLSPRRREHLELLLAKAGDSVFPFVDAKTNPQKVSENVTQSAPPGAASDWFVVGSGRINVACNVSTNPTSRSTSHSGEER